MAELPPAVPPPAPRRPVGFGWPLHTLAVLCGLAVLWTSSVPGIMFFASLAAGLACLGVGAAWLVLMVLALITGRRSWRMLVVPVGALVLVALLTVDASLRARWVVVRPAFEAVVRDLPPASADQAGSDEESGWEDVDVPRRIGTYDITSASRVPGGGIVFYEAHGNFVDYAGFAYLPDGLTVESTAWFEAPRFTHLGGDWYAFTASW